jgi:hypothetical protein
MSSMDVAPQLDKRANWDVFVSYRHIADENPTGWVDSFCTHLQKGLIEYLSHVAIWRDKSELRAGDNWRDEIAEAIDSARIFVAVINASYFDSPVCREELNSFLGKINAAPGGQGRVLVPIFKDAGCDLDEMPQELQELHRRDFFSDCGRPLHPQFDERDYWIRMAQVVQDLAKTLKRLQGERDSLAPGRVFVARVGRELEQRREELCSNLQQQGWLVLPKHDYFWNSADVANRIQKDLNQADLCVHLISGAEPKDPARPARDLLQLELAHAAMKERGLPAPLAWIQGAATAAPAMRPLIARIENELANHASHGVTCLEGDFAELKAEMFARLTKPAAAAQAAPADGAAVRDLAILVESGERDELEGLKDLLVNEQLAEPSVVRLAGARPEKEERLRDVLAACPQVLIFWSGQSEDWVGDVLRLPALRGHWGKNKICVYASGADCSDKRGFRSNHARLLQATGDANAAGLRDFLASLPGAGA